jgi:AbrB family looped-hinge helix DNA binding protein
MPKVTSKLQLTVPKRIADQYGIRPGDELEWIAAGESIRVEMANKAISGREMTANERLALFDANTKWLDELHKKELKEARANEARTTQESRGWTREELYEERGFSRRH